MSSRLEGKIAIITGGASGLGRAISLAFAREGAAVVCADWDKSGGQDTVEEIIEQTGKKAIYVCTDVSSAPDVEALVKQTVSSYGRLDIMVNCAGIAVEATVGDAPIWEVSENTWDVNMRINAKGVFLGCKYAAAEMIKQDPCANGDRGWIINISSQVGLVGLPGIVSYCASKHAVAGITKAVALDCAPFRVHCNAICPSWTETAMVAPIFAKEGVRESIEALHPFRGIGQPEDIARAALFLASADNSWMTGVMMPVDGGYTAR